MLVVPDAKKNCRFSDLRLVAPADGFRFYAAAPLLTRDGTPIGALSVMDCSPRASFPIEQRTPPTLTRTSHTASAPNARRKPAAP
jgi:GAF domain-containing protein